MPDPVITAAIYGRVSTEKQDYAVQVNELKAYAERMGWQIAAYLEKESAKLGSRRPMLRQLLQDATLRKFDVVLVWRIDRFGRNVVEFAQNILTLDSLGIRFIACSQGIDTDQRNPLAKMLRTLLSMFAEFELDMLHERTREGLDNYRRLYKLGKVGPGKERRSRSRKDMPHGRPRKVFSVGKAIAMRSAGMSWRTISKDLKVKVTTLRRAVAQAA